MALTDGLQAYTTCRTFCSFQSNWATCQSREEVGKEAKVSLGSQESVSVQRD